MDAAATSSPDLVTLLRRRPYTIALLGMAGLALGLLYGFIAKPWYEAQLAVIPAQQEKSSGLLSAVSNAVGELPLDVSLGGGGLDVDRIQAVLRSQSVTDAVIQKFGLMSRYHQKYIETARRVVAQHCPIKMDKRSSVVTLTCEDTDPATAQAMAAYFGEVGNDVFRRISESSAREERRFLEGRLAQARLDVDTASRRLREFQEKYKIIDLPEQSKAIVSAVASLKGEYLSKELELGYLSSFSSPTETTALQLRQQLAVMQSKLNALEGEPDNNNSAAPPNSEPPAKAGPKKRGKKEDDLFPPAMVVPKLRYELEQLFREQKIQETLFLLLTQRYEMARISEARNTSAFQILDAPTLPTMKSRPKRSVIALLGLLLGLMAGMAVAVLPYWIRAYKKSAV